MWFDWLCGCDILIDLCVCVCFFCSVVYFMPFESYYFITWMKMNTINTSIRPSRIGVIFIENDAPNVKAEKQIGKIGCETMHDKRSIETAVVTCWHESEGLEVSPIPVYMIYDICTRYKKNEVCLAENIFSPITNI